jgi:hypothetical protein
LLCASFVIACSGDDTNGSPGGTDAAADAPSDGTAAETSTADGSVDSTVPGEDGQAGQDGSSGVSEGGTDGGSEAAADGGEGGVAGDAGPLLSCTTWKFSAPIVLDSVSDDGGAIFNGALWVGEPAANQVHVISQPGAPAFRVYTFDKTSSAVTTIDGPAVAIGGEESVHHFTIGGSEQVTQVVVDNASATPGTLSAYLLPDGITSAGQIPQPFQISRDGFPAVMPLDDTDVFIALDYENLIPPPDLEYELAVGVATQSAQAPLAQVAISPNADGFLSPAITAANGNVYVFSSNGVQGNGTQLLGESLWVVPSTGVISTTITASAFDTGGISTMEDVAPGIAAGTTNLAYYSEASDGSSLSIAVGQVANTQLGSVTAGALTKVRTYTDLSELPVASGSAQWSGDDIGFVAPATGTSDAGTVAGANFLWVNARGDVRAENVGPNSILRNRGTAIGQIVASPSSVSATSAAWDIAWVETQANGQVLLYNELDCAVGD